MTDPVPSKATCHVCDTPDGDHLDWCTTQAREQRSSKDVSKLAEWRQAVDDDPIDVGDAFVELLEIAEGFQRALRGVQSCSTCERCRGAATLALGGEPGPLERLQRPFNPEEARAYKAFINEYFEGPHCSTCGCGLTPEPAAEQLVTLVCTDCGESYDGYPGDNVCLPCWQKFDGMTLEDLTGAAQPPPAEHPNSVNTIGVVRPPGDVQS